MTNELSFDTKDFFILSLDAENTHVRRKVGERFHYIIGGSFDPRIRSFSTWDEARIVAMAYMVDHIGRCKHIYNLFQAMEVFKEWPPHTLNQVNEYDDEEEDEYDDEEEDEYDDEEEDEYSDL